MALWAQADLENLVGLDALLRALDRNNDGEIDDGAIGRLQEDSDAWILGYVRGNHDYAGIVSLLAQNPPAQLRRMSLHYARILLCQAHPEYFRIDWEPLFEALRTEAIDVQRGKFRLDIGSASAPVPANVGGAIFDSQGRTEAGTDLCDFEKPTFRHMGDY
jgi:hypothetical protein